MTGQESSQGASAGRPTSCQSAQPRLESRLRRLASVEAELWAVVALLMVGDVTLTAYGLSLGLSESNPLAAVVLDSHGVEGLAVLKGLVLACGGIAARSLPVPMRVVVPLGLLLPTLVAVVVNLVLVAAVAPV